MGVIGEWKYGAGRSHQNIVGIFAGTGIGGGLVVNNQFCMELQEVQAQLGM